MIAGFPSGYEYKEPCPNCYSKDTKRNPHKVGSQDHWICNRCDCEFAVSILSEREQSDE